MPPEERRAALIAATLPLLKEHGPGLSTRQIAEAAGVAEGTIFGVFPDKQSLIQAAVLSVFDPAPLEQSLSAIDPTIDLQACMSAIAEALTRRITDNAWLFIVMRKAAMAEEAAAPQPPPHSFFAEMASSRRRLLNAITAAIEPHRDQLRLEPHTVAMLLTAVLGVGTHKMFDDLPLPGPDELVTTLLHGLIIRPEHRGEEPVEKMPARPSTFTGDSIPC